MSRKIVRIPSIKCPDCGSRMIVRSSSQLTTLCREIRLRCENEEECGSIVVGDLQITRRIAPSMRPNDQVHLPLANQNLRHGAARRPANDDFPQPANDDDAGRPGEGEMPMIETG